MRRLFSFFFLLINISASAQSEKSIQKQVYKTIETYRNHHAVYEDWFKFQSGNDTFYHLKDSRVYFLLKTPTISQSISYSSYDTIMEVSMIDKHTSLSLKNGRYYHDDKKNNKHLDYYHYIKEQCFKPLRLKSKDLKTYKLQADTSSSYYILCHESVENNQMDTFKFKTVLYVRKSDYLPMIQESWVEFGGGFQYSLQKLRSIEALSSKGYGTFMRQSDSLSLAFRTHINGDSISNLYYQSYRNLEVGDTVVAISGYISLSTDSFNLFEHGDSILILDFSYTTCGWCIHSIPVLINLYDRYKNTGVALYSLDPFENDWPRIEKFVKHYGIRYPIVEIENLYNKDYGVRAYPTLFVIKNGILVYKHVGFSSNLEEEVIKAVEKALGKT